MSDAACTAATDQHRRRLIKRVPAAAAPAAAPAASTAPQRSLRRAPSAPVRSRYSAHALPAAGHSRSPTLGHDTSDSTAWSSPAQPDNSSAYAANSTARHHPRYSVTEKSSADLLGQRFDSAAVISSFNAVPYSADPLPAPAREEAPVARGTREAGAADAAPLRRAGATPQPVGIEHTSASNNGHLTPANPAVALSQSLAATGRKMDDLPQQRAGLTGMASPRQRYSDEAKESKKEKKKSGLASFFNLSSPRRPAISAPENPVHVTHVGYDTETGEFTVRFAVLHPPRISAVCMGRGPARATPPDAYTGEGRSEGARESAHLT